MTPAISQAITRSPLITDRTGYRYFVLPTGGNIEQLELHADDDRHRLSRTVKYIVGSGKHAIALVNDDRGYLTEMPIGWFSYPGEWKLNPGYELKNHRFSRAITAGCVACHATTADFPLVDANYFPAPIEDGIDCSRCHGEANGHSDFWMRAGDGEPPASAQFVHPGRLSSQRANDVCLQCHLQGDVTLPLAGHSAFDFRPGQRLLDQRHDFLIAGQRETLGVASHGARMLQSRCYQSSAGQLTCIHCHDAHRPAAAHSRAVYDAACAKCHSPDACRRTNPGLGAESTTSCVGCHMPRRSTREGLHLVFTDHAIPRLPSSDSPPQPQLLKSNSNVELVSAWPQTTPDNAALGAAHVLLHETMGPQLRSLEIACTLLQEAVATNSPDLDSRYWLGSAWLARGKPGESLAQLGQVVGQHPENHQARFRIALAREAAGDAVTAILEYERLLSDAPHWLQPYPRLAQLYLSRQRPADCARILQAQIIRQPSAAAYASLALAERLAGRSHEHALATVEQAIELDSRSPDAYLTRGTLWLLSADNGRASADYQRALELDPSSHVAQEALRALEASR